MSDTGHTNLDTGHPAPARHRVSAIDLAAALCSAPAAWLAQLLFAFSATSYLCRAGDTSATPGWLQPLLIALNLLALAVAAAALTRGLVLLRRTAHEHQSRSGGVLDAGEGRTRFLAVWSVFISIVFIVAILANSFSLLLVPLCQV
jgi:hypothetical protein